MKKYELLKKQVEQINEANSKLKDDKIGLMLRMLESTSKRINRLEQDKVINIPENKFYLNAYEFYATAATIRLNLLTGEIKNYYRIPGFNTMEDIENIFEGFSPNVPVIVYSDKYLLPENLSGSFILTENGLKIIFVTTEEELANFKQKGAIILHITNINNDGGRE